MGSRKKQEKLEKAALTSAVESLLQEKKLREEVLSRDSYMVLTTQKEMS